MASTFEMMEGNVLKRPGVFESEMTKVVSDMNTYMQMLGESREKEALLIKGYREDISRIRFQVTRWLEEEPPKSELVESIDSTQQTNGDCVQIAGMIEKVLDEANLIDEHKTMLASALQQLHH